MRVREHRGYLAPPTRTVAFCDCMHAAHSFMMFRVPLERAAAFMFLPVTVLIISSIHIYLGEYEKMIVTYTRVLILSQFN